MIQVDQDEAARRRSEKALRYRRQCPPRRGAYSYGCLQPLPPSHSPPLHSPPPGASVAPKVLSAVEFIAA